MLKNYLIFVLIAVLFLLIGADFSFAARKLEALPETVTNIPSLIGYIFYFLMGLGGLLAVLALITGAFRYLISAGNPEEMRDARDRMFKSIIGLVLLLSSYLIITIINPELMVKVVAPLQKVPGLYFVGGGKESSAPLSVADISKITSSGYENIIYKCIENIPDQPVLLVYFFPEVNSQVPATDTTFNSVRVEELKCGGQAVSLNLGKSYVTAFKKTGVYVYFDPGCGANSYRSWAYTSSQADMGLFKNKAKCVEIINNPDKKIYYGAFLYNYGSLCLPPEDVIFSNTDARVTKTGLNPIYSSIIIFQWEPDPKTAGDGVKFYSHPFSEFLGGGSYYISNEQITDPGPKFEGEPDYFTFDFTNSGMPPEKQKECCFDPENCCLQGANCQSGGTQSSGTNQPNFVMCPGAMNIFGNYYVIFYVKYANEIYCGLFGKQTADINQNLKLAPITKKWLFSERYGFQGDFYKVLIYPVK